MGERNLLAILQAKEKWQQHNGADSDENVLKDMLSDMLHLADTLGVYLDIDGAKDNYSAEAGICEKCGDTPQEALNECTCHVDHVHEFTPDDIEMDRRSNG
jgi:hypothetical protein